MSVYKIVTYRTSYEVNFLRDSFRSNRAAFLGYAELIMSGRRNYNGPDMNVNVKRVKKVVTELLELHRRESPPEITDRIQ